MNAWETRFYRQLFHTTPGADEPLPAIDPVVEPDRHTALQAALRQALVESERAHSD